MFADIFNAPEALYLCLPLHRQRGHIETTQVQSHPKLKNHETLYIYYLDGSC